MQYKRLKMGCNLIVLIFAIGRCNAPKSSDSQAKRKASSSPATSSHGSKASSNQIDSDTANALLNSGIYGVRQGNPPVMPGQLNSTDFKIINAAVSLLKLVQSFVPTIRYTSSKQTDYVKVLRCKASLSITGGSSTTNLLQINTAGLSNIQQQAFYGAFNYFGWAGEKGCVMITPGGGTTNNPIKDAWSTDGTHKYVLQPCVYEARLTQKSAAGTRNCSRFLTVVDGIKDYKNSRLDNKNQSLALMNYYNNQMNVTAATWHETAVKLANAIQDCDDSSYNSQVTAKKWAAYAQVAASSIETAFEVSKMVSAKSPSIIGLGMGTQGMALSKPFKELMVSPDQYPKKCTNAIMYQTMIKNITNKLLLEGMYYNRAKLEEKSAQTDVSNVGKSNSTGGEK